MVWALISGCEKTTRQDSWGQGRTGRPAFHHPGQEDDVMFKVIGATVVYGFALFGLARYLKVLHSGGDAL